MKPILIPAICILTLAFQTSLWAQATTPKKGSEERTAILDSVRAPLEKAIDQKVIFVVEHMKVDGDWAFVKAVPKTKDGEAISYKGTEFEEEADEADELTIALLQKKDKKWVLVEHGYFTTDVWWIDLWERHKGCPKTIFEKPLR